MSGEAGHLRAHTHTQQTSKTGLLGIDIGGTKTAIVLSRSAPNVLWRGEFETLPTLGADHALEKIVTLARCGVAQTGCTPTAIGVSCGGPLDRVRGIIQRPPNLPTWGDIPIKDILQQKFGVPCFVENDANAGAVAENQFGAGKGCRHMVFLTMGTGLGAGLILNGRIFHGANAMAGEIGHVRLSDSGPMGYGKAGSVEGWASGGGMAQHAAWSVQEALQAGQFTMLTASLPYVTARDVGQALLAGDAVAAQIVHRTGRRLGEVLAILVDVLNPHRIVIGGLALRLGDALLEPARQRMREEALADAAAVCEIVPAALGERIGDVAALCVAMGLHADPDEA
ncbi:glucokinase [Granulicella pectinivorans]|uniref:Glucokinase n=1 Tax=Granulicella pectinivorans TaxID=474950 RepID=A0A1I6L417_9BACT|nr:glucokinase [Granulicella pectinivorans]